MLLTPLASRIYDALLGLFYPQQCQLCGSSVDFHADGVACADCWGATRLQENCYVRCWKCGLLTLVGESRDFDGNALCGHCESAPFAAARACGIYEKALRANVLALKRVPYLPRRLLTSLVALQKMPPLSRAGLIVPVPLHVEREKSRGFNQAAVIAREISQSVGLPLDEMSLVRSRFSERHRAGMDAKGRQQSVEEAFDVVCPNAMRAERVLLVDDVFTTGATVSACTAALLEAGAAEVLVLTLARSQS